MRLGCGDSCHRRSLQGEMVGAPGGASAQLLWTISTLRWLCWATAPETLPSTTCLTPERPREPIAIRAASWASAASTIALQTGPPSCDRGGRLEAESAGPLGAFVGGVAGTFLRRVGEDFHRLRLDRHAGGAEERDLLDLLGDDQDHHLARAELGRDLVDRRLRAVGAVVGDQDRAALVGHRLDKVGRKAGPSACARID